jgi:hypothetical protein
MDLVPGTAPADVGVVLPFDTCLLPTSCCCIGKFTALSQIMDGWLGSHYDDHRFAVFL